MFSSVRKRLLARFFKHYLFYHIICILIIFTVSIINGVLYVIEARVIDDFINRYYLHETEVSIVIPILAILFGKLGLGILNEILYFLIIRMTRFAYADWTLDSLPYILYKKHDFFSLKGCSEGEVKSYLLKGAQQFSNIISYTYDILFVILSMIFDFIWIVIFFSEFPIYILLSLFYTLPVEIGLNILTERLNRKMAFQFEKVNAQYSGYIQDLLIFRTSYITQNLYIKYMLNKLHKLFTQLWRYFLPMDVSLAFISTLFSQFNVLYKWAIFLLAFWYASDWGITIGQVLIFISMRQTYMQKVYRLFTIYNSIGEMRGTCKQLMNIIQQEGPYRDYNFENPPNDLYVPYNFKDPRLNAIEETAPHVSEFVGKEPTIRLSNIRVLIENKPILSIQGDLTFEKNTIYLIQGANGCGKSTLFNLLYGFHSLSEGTLKTTPEFNTHDWRQGILYISQHSQVLHGTIKEHLCFPYHPDVLKDDILIEIAHKFEFPIEWAQFVNGLNTTIMGSGSIRLSGGQKQKLNLLRLLVQWSLCSNLTARWNVWLFDEPTSDCDQETHTWFCHFLQLLQSERDSKDLTLPTILWISHHQDSVNFVDRQVRMTL